MHSVTLSPVSSKWTPPRPLPAAAMDVERLLEFAEDLLEAAGLHAVCRWSRCCRASGRSTTAPLPAGSHRLDQRRQAACDAADAEAVDQRQAPRLVRRD